MNRRKAGKFTGATPRTKRPRVRRSMSPAQRVERRKEVQRNYYYNHRTLSPAYTQRQAEIELFNLTGLKRCKICGEQKTPEEFYSTKAGAFRLTGDCRDCRTAISLENYYRRKQREGN